MMHPNEPLSKHPPSPAACCAIQFDHQCWIDQRVRRDGRALLIVQQFRRHAGLKKTRILDHHHLQSDAHLWCRQANTDASEGAKHRIDQALDLVRANLVQRNRAGGTVQHPRPSLLNPQVWRPLSHQGVIDAASIDS
jgi:hypothetical protein